METKEPSYEDFTGIDKILDHIKTGLKAELDSIKNELKTDLKAELDSIKNELKAELNSIKTREFPPHVEPPTPVPPPPHGDFPEIEIPEIKIFDKKSNTKTEEYSLSDFTGIEVRGAFEVEIICSDLYSVSVTAEDELFRNLDVFKEGETLRVGHSRHISWRARITKPKARITLPILKELYLSGATKGAISGFNSSESFKLNMSGASSVSGEMTVGDAEFDLSGASRARLTGSAKDVVIEASGANLMDLRGFSVHNAAVKLSGASHITVKMDGKLDARLSGVSHLSWIGDPVIGNIRTSGASTLSKE